MYLLDFNVLDLNLNRSVWRCDLSQTACRMTLTFEIDSAAHDAFQALPLTKFLSKMNESYPYVADVPLRSFFMFQSTHLCQQGFSATFCMKSKCCARLCMKDDRLVSLSKRVSQIEALF